MCLSRKAPWEDVAHITHSQASRLPEGLSNMRHVTSLLRDAFECVSASPGTSVCEKIGLTMSSIVRSANGESMGKLAPLCLARNPGSDKAFKRLFLAKEIRLFRMKEAVTWSASSKQALDRHLSHCAQSVPCKRKATAWSVGKKVDVKSLCGMESPQGSKQPTGQREEFSTPVATGAVLKKLCVETSEKKVISKPALEKLSVGSSEKKVIPKPLPSQKGKTAPTPVTAEGPEVKVSFRSIDDMERSLDKVIKGTAAEWCKPTAEVLNLQNQLAVAPEDKKDEARLALHKQRTLDAIKRLTMEQLRKALIKSWSNPEEDPIPEFQWELEWQLHILHMGDKMKKPEKAQKSPTPNPTGKLNERAPLADVTPFKEDSSSPSADMATGKGAGDLSPSQHG